MANNMKKLHGKEETEWVKNNAYFRWLNAGQPDGNNLNFWLEAKNEFSIKYYGKPFPHVQREENLKT